MHSRKFPLMFALACLGAACGPVRRPDGGTGLIGERAQAPDFAAPDQDGKVRTHGTPQQIVTDPVAISEYLGNSFTEDPFKRAQLSVGAAAPVPTNACGLYDPVLAAYKIMKAGYQEDHSNTIVVFTDSTNSKPGSMQVDQLQLELEKLTDTTKPIRVVLLGIGPDVDINELTAIAKTTGGKAFKVDNPAEIGTIFLQALLRTST